MEYKLNNAYRINNSEEMCLAKNTKVILRAVIKYSSWSDIYGFIVEHPNGTEFRFVDSNRGGFDYIELSEEIEPSTKIFFVTTRSLSEYNDDDILVYGLKTKWTVHKTDWYKKYREEWIRDFGYDIHERTYNR